MKKLKKLTDAESKDLYEFLHYLKRNNWIIDLHSEWNGESALNLIYLWHFALTGYVAAYDELDAELQLCYMTKDLTDYFKKDINDETKKICSRCRKSKDISAFMGRKVCKLCYKKKNHQRRKR